MAIRTPFDSQIADAISQAHIAGGDEALSVISDLMKEVAKDLDSAKQGKSTIEDLSIAFENAEVALHEIVARLATGKG
ncbi:MAG: hypothetical protein PVI92_04035 [Chromatiales bacterium]|jgi:hypothetical protein